MIWKKITKALLYPHLAIIILFLPISVTLLIFSLIYFEPSSAISIISYLFALYMLIVLCLRIPRIVAYFKSVKNNNQFLHRFSTDVHLRMNISLYGSLIWNGIYAIFQLGLGFYHGSVWFYSMATYYIMLAIIRFFLVKHTRTYQANEQTQMELKKYYLCGWLLLIINLALSIIVFFIVYWNRTFVHHEITTIMLATYTFVTFTFAIINCVKYKKYNSPVYSAAKTITLIAACVSMLTLETTMLTTFGGNNVAEFRQILLATTGAIVCLFTIVVAIRMIIKASKQLKAFMNTSNNKK